MRRGLTMIELLISLGLLSAVMAAIVSWSQIAARTGDVLTLYRRESRSSVRELAGVSPAVI